MRNGKGFFILWDFHADSGWILCGGWAERRGGLSCSDDDALMGGIWQVQWADDENRPHLVNGGIPGVLGSEDKG